MKAKNLLKSIFIIMLAIVAATSATACSSGGSNNGDDKETEKQLDIYIVSGQSNAVGFSRWGDSKKEYKDVYYFGYGEGTEPLDYAFMINVQSGLGVNGNCFGPEMGMAAYLSEQYKNDETTDVAIVKFGWGGRTLWDYFLSYTSVNENLGSKTNCRDFCDEDDAMYCAPGYWYLIKTVRKAVQKATGMGYTKVNFVSVCWMQGENDALLPQSQKVYDRLLKNFMKDLRFDLNAENLPFIIGQIKIPQYDSQGNISQDNVDGQAAIIAQQKKVVTEDDYATLVDTSDLTMEEPNNIWHYDKESMLTLGTRFAAEAYKFKNK
ncbi:MAG TPA: hypothetical protein DHU65_05300 [Clostridiales bacterium]|nr:hypothetical protein [Clostridiales bacterium]